MKMPEMPPFPQACDVTPVSWSNLFSADQLRSFALQYAESVREACARECDTIDEEEKRDSPYYGIAKECAAAIRRKEE